MTDTFHISYARALRGVMTFGHYQLGLLKLSQGLEEGGGLLCGCKHQDMKVGHQSQPRCFTNEDDFKNIGLPKPDGQCCFLLF